MPPTEPAAAMSSRRTLVDFFNRSLAAFQTSKDAFRVVCTLPPRGHDESPSPTSRRPQQLVKSLVVLDSSFNPPTLAHMRMAASAVQDYQGGTAGGVRLLLLLAVNNADKKPKPAAFPERLGMMRAFAEDLLDDLLRQTPGDVDVDLGLTTMPYFHEKSQAIADTGFYGEEGPEQQVYLAGYDTLIRIFNPKYYNAAQDGSGEAPMRRALDPFLGRSRLRITMRTEDDWGDEGEQVAYLEKLREEGLEEVGGRREWGDRVEMVKGDEEVVSSTRVREASGRGDGEALGRLLSPRVREWVLEERLYRDE